MAWHRMETPAKKCARLLVALEDLTTQEAGAIAARDAVALQQIQRRAEPVILYLCQHAGEVSGAWARHRVAALVERRSRALSKLSAQVEGARARLEDVHSNQRRVAVLAPMYGRPSARRVRLSAVG